MGGRKRGPRNKNNSKRTDTSESATADDRTNDAPTSGTVSESTHTSQSTRGVNRPTDPAHGRSTIDSSLLAARDYQAPSASVESYIPPGFSTRPFSVNRRSRNPRHVYYEAPHSAEGTSRCDKQAHHGDERASERPQEASQSYQQEDASRDQSSLSWRNLRGQCQGGSLAPARLSQRTISYADQEMAGTSEVPGSQRRGDLVAMGRVPQSPRGGSHTFRGGPSQFNQRESVAEVYKHATYVPARYPLHLSSNLNPSARQFVPRSVQQLNMTQHVPPTAGSLQPATVSSMGTHFAGYRHLYNRGISSASHWLNNTAPLPFNTALNAARPRHSHIPLNQTYPPARQYPACPANPTADQQIVLVPYRPHHPRFPMNYQSGSAALHQAMFGISNPAMFETNYQAIPGVPHHAIAGVTNQAMLESTYRAAAVANQAMLESTAAASYTICGAAAHPPIAADNQIIAIHQAMPTTNNQTVPVSATPAITLESVNNQDGASRHIQFDGNVISMRMTPRHMRQQGNVFFDSLSHRNPLEASPEAPNQLSEDCIYVSPMKILQSDHPIDGIPTPHWVSLQPRGSMSRDPLQPCDVRFYKCSNGTLVDITQNHTINEVDQIYNNRLRTDLEDELVGTAVETLFTPPRGTPHHGIICLDTAVVNPEDSYAKAKLFLLKLLAEFKRNGDHLALLNIMNHIMSVYYNRPIEDHIDQLSTLLEGNDTLLQQLNEGYYPYIKEMQDNENIYVDRNRLSPLRPIESYVSDHFA